MAYPSNMSKKAVHEYLEKTRFRYHNRGRERKTALSDELVKVTGHERKYAIMLLRKPRRETAVKEGLGVIVH